MNPEDESKRALNRGKKERAEGEKRLSEIDASIENLERRVEEEGSGVKPWPAPSPSSEHKRRRPRRKR